MIFTISAFSVPLIYDERTTLTTAIYVSVRTVLGNFLVCIAWGFCSAAWSSAQSYYLSCCSLPITGLPRAMRFTSVHFQRPVNEPL